MSRVCVGLTPRVNHLAGCTRVLRRNSWSNYAYGPRTFPFRLDRRELRRAAFRVRSTNERRRVSGHSRDLACAIVPDISLGCFYEDQENACGAVLISGSARYRGWSRTPPPFLAWARQTTIRLKVLTVVASGQGSFCHRSATVLIKPAHLI